MNYFLDTEFNEFGGALMSLALVRDDGESLYLVYPPPVNIGPWVATNVEPVLFSIPDGHVAHTVSHAEGAHLIASFLGSGGGVPYIITDWPDDVRYFCQAIITGPGMMVSIPRIQFDIVRVDAYPTSLPCAVQHNALWDALALRRLLKPGV